IKDIRIYLCSSYETAFNGEQPRLLRWLPLNNLSGLPELDVLFQKQFLEPQKCHDGMDPSRHGFIDNLHFFCDTRAYEDDIGFRSVFLCQQPSMGNHGRNNGRQMAYQIGMILLDQVYHYRTC